MSDEDDSGGSYYEDDLKDYISSLEMVSPHNVCSVTAMKFSKLMSTYELFRICISDDPFLEGVRQSKLPWHVVGSNNFLIDVNLLPSRNDIGIDAFRWEVNKTLIFSISDLDNEETMVKGNTITSYRFVKRYYNSSTSKFLKCIIVAVYPPSSQCTSRTFLMKIALPLLFICIFLRQMILLNPVRR